uniref:Eukaryotic translation initiation factor 3 subunit G N-terminal domain-containing protein n=1 Tax=Amphimedon queenslandica TaxID=400682 RepID=A0A1X7TQL7_AMPQE
MSYCQKWGKLSDASSNGKGANPSRIQVAEDVDLTLTTNTETLEQDDAPLKKLRPQHKMASCCYCKGTTGALFTVLFHQWKFE